MDRKEFVYPKDLILTMDNHPKMKYNKNKSFTLNNHYGQVKLFSNELEFLLTFVCDDNINTKKKVVVYVGAGPGEHLVYLTRMFPTIEWHLFDCRFDIKLKEIKNVFLEIKYFDDESVKIYKELNENPDIDIYLISDIRNLTYDSESWNVEQELKIMDDMEVQKKWVEEIKPKYSMLKFRLPFPEEAVLKILGKEVSYLPGIIYKQPWSREKSAETRLVVSGDNLKPIKYSIIDYEQCMFYHNSVIRQKEYIFPFYSEIEDIFISKKLILNKRYDTAYTLTLLYQYFVRQNPNMKEKIMKERIIKILKYIGCTDPNFKYIYQNDEMKKLAITKHV